MCLCNPSLHRRGLGLQGNSSEKSSALARLWHSLAKLPASFSPHWLNPGTLERIKWQQGEKACRLGLRGSQAVTDVLPMLLDFGFCHKDTWRQAIERIRLSLVSNTDCTTAYPRLAVLSPHKHCTVRIVHQSFTVFSYMVRKTQQLVTPNLLFLLLTDSTRVHSASWCVHACAPAPY